MSELFFVAGSGWVHGIDAATLVERWSLELRPSWFKVGSQFVSLREDETYLYALAHGQIHQICKATGELVRTSEEIGTLKNGPAVFSAGLEGDAPSEFAAAVQSDGDAGNGGGEGS